MAAVRYLDIIFDKINVSGNGTKISFAENYWYAEVVVPLMY
jgi:hypothetical protein